VTTCELKCLLYSVIVCWLFLAEGDVAVDRKSETERKLTAEPDSLRRPQPGSIDNTPNSSCTANTTASSCSSSSSTTTTTNTSAAAIVEPSTSELVNIFDDFDWDMDSLESLQCLSEEDLKKRHSVMIEKVCCCSPCASS